MIEALWASLDAERPSGDDPARVASALSRFYTDLQRGYLQGRRNRWRTPLFQAQDPGIRDNLEQALALTTELSHAIRPDSPALAKLRQIDPEIRKAFWALEQEEKTFGIAPNESPKLMQFDYLFEGWARGLLGFEPVEEFLEQFLKEANATRGEIGTALKTAKNRDKESVEESSAIDQASDGTERLIQAVDNLLSNLSRGAAACRPLRDAILASGKTLGQSYHRLETVAPVTEPCPFCGGNLSLSGRCRSCGRRLPHLEDVQGDFEPEGPQSEFISMNLRRVDLALKAFEADPDDDKLWKEFQDAVRHFGKQVDAGKQHLEMISNAPDRPIDSASPERLAEAELSEISAAFVVAQRALSAFAFQPFPPYDDLPDGWRDSLLAIEPKMQALENKWTPPSEEPSEIP